MPVPGVLADTTVRGPVSETAVRGPVAAPCGGVDAGSALGSALGSEPLARVRSTSVGVTCSPVDPAYRVPVPEYAGYCPDVLTGWPAPVASRPCESHSRCGSDLPRVTVGVTGAPRTTIRNQAHSANITRTPTLIVLCSTRAPAGMSANPPPS